MKLAPEAVSDLILVCDHASPAVPGKFDALGLDHTVFHRHVAFDIGAAELTFKLSALLPAPAVLSTFSRLLIDPNRSIEDPTLIVKSSDGVVVPGNRDLDEAAISDRIETYHRSYHRAIEQQFELARRDGKIVAFVGIHSFTPIMNGFERPWDVAVLWNRDPRLARALLRRLRVESDLCVGENEPYSGRVAGFSMDWHGGGNGLPNAVIEVRQDLIDTHHGVEHWARKLARILSDVAGQRDIFEIRHYQP